MMKVSGSERAIEILSNASGKSVAVIGDVMIDRFFWGHVSRISPEAPVPVIDIVDETFHLGGAANVASNLKSLGLNPILSGIIGVDNSGIKFKKLAEKAGIDCSGLYVDPHRPTTVKTRILGNNQHIARVDREVRKGISAEGHSYIISILKSREDLAGIIFEDYDKGAISKELIKDVIDFAIKNKLPVFVDPKKDNFFDYKGVTLFKPNKKEAAQALDIPIRDFKDVEAAGKMLLTVLGCENVLLTLGAEGMMLFERNGEVSSVATCARQVSDVSGAGDTAIATMAASLIGGATAKEAASLANIAAGIVCEIPGIVSIDKNELFNSIERAAR